MPQINSKAVLKDLEKTISPVLVINNSSLKPYVEVFDYAPENIYQQPLGKLVGFFEVKEYSDDSAYIVNFLTSVLKKEYYINPKRPVTESLDSALHKVNLALSELAKHGNVDWLGKLNAAICVLEKNSTHFSVAGSAKIFLFRSDVLTDISEDLASDSLDPHPLKTFVNVSSGRIEKNDRLLITSEDIFHIFSFVELKKNFQRFEGEKLVQFFRTALSNQMEMVMAIMAEIHEEEPLRKIKKTTTKKKATIEESINVFSGDSFEEPAEAATKKQATVASSDLESSKQIETEYTDKKTGHIYVQGENTENTEISKTAILLENSREKISELWYLTKTEIRRKYITQKKQVGRKWQQFQQERAEKAELRAEQLQREQEEALQREAELQEQIAKEQEQQRILFEQQEAERIIREELELQEKMAEQQQTETQPETLLEDDTKTPTELSFKQKLTLARNEQKSNHVVDLRNPQDKIDKEETTMQPEEAEEFDFEQALDVPIYQQAQRDAEIKLLQRQQRKQALEDFLKKCLEIWSLVLNFAKNRFSKFKKEDVAAETSQNKQHHIAPQFSLIKKSFEKFTTTQKKYTVISLIAIFILPLFIVHFLNLPKKPTITDLAKTQIQTQPTIAPQKNLVSAQKQTVLSRAGILGTLFTSVGPIAYTKSSVLVANNGQFKEFSITQGEGNVTKATFMNDLSLVLLITDQNKIISFSPVSFKFTDNNINLSGGAGKNFFGTYLTYLYVLDPVAGQIYRYPRANGGFGEKTNWLKGTNSISSASDMTVDDSIWAIQNNQINKYFKGQNQPLTIESSATPVHFDKIYTSLDCSGVWVLDNQFGRLVEFNKADGTIIKQYSLDDLKTASSFSVDEKNKTAYAVTSSGLVSIAL